MNIIGRHEYALAGSLAGEAGQRAAQEAAQRAGQEAAQRAGQEAGQRAAQEGAQRAAQEGAQRAGQEAAQRAGQEAAERSAREAAERAGKDYTKYAAAAAAAGVGLYVYGSASDAAEESNNTPRNITKVEKKDGTVYTVYFDPAIKILQADSISISGSQTTPSIDGPQSVASVVGDNRITIDFGNELTSNTPGGSIQVTTTVGAHTSDTVASAAAAVGGAAGGGIGGALQGALGGLGSALGIDPSKLKWILLAVCIVIIAIGLFMAFK